MSDQQLRSWSAKFMRWAMRPWWLREQVCLQLLERCRAAVPRPQTFRFARKRVSLDSTVIDLCVSLFGWATFRRAKGAIKLPLVLDHDGALPGFAVITEANVSDVKAAQGLSFDPGAVVVDDRGNNHYPLFARWTARWRSLLRWSSIQSSFGWERNDVVSQMIAQASS